MSRSGLLELLANIYSTQGAWAKAKTTILERLGINRSEGKSKDETSLWDTVKLIEVLLKIEELAEAQLYGRRSLQGFKKLREAGYNGYKQCLVLLVQICHQANNLEDEEAFAALLETHRAEICKWNGEIALEASTPKPEGPEVCEKVPASNDVSAAVAVEDAGPSKISAHHGETFITQPSKPESADYLHLTTEDTARKGSVELTQLEDELIPGNTTIRGSSATQGTLTPRTHSDMVELTLLDAGSILAPGIWAGDVPSSGGEDTPATQAPALTADVTIRTSNKALSETNFGTLDVVTYTQESLAAKAPSMSSTDMTASDGTSSSILSSLASLSSRPTTPTSSVGQGHNLVSPIATFISFCQHELGQTPHFMVGRGRTGFNAFVRFKRDKTRQDIAKVVGYDTKEKAKDATALLAYEMLFSLTVDPGDAIRLSELEGSRPVYQGDRSPVGHDDTLLWNQPMRRNATTSRLHPSSERTKQLSMTELADIRKDWLSITPGSSSALSDHPRTRFASQLPVTDQEWSLGDELAFSVDGPKSVPCCQTDVALEAHSLSPHTPHENPRSTSSACSTCHLQLSNLSERDAAQHARECPEKSDDASTEDGRTTSLAQSTDYDQRNREILEPVKTCFICGLSFEGLDQAAVAFHVDKCLDASSDLPKSPVGRVAVAEAEEESDFLLSRAELDYSGAEGPSSPHLYRSLPDVSAVFSKLFLISVPTLHRRNIIVVGDPCCGKSSLIRCVHQSSRLKLTDLCQVLDHAR